MSVRVVLAPELTRARFHEAALSFGWVLHRVVDSAEHPYEEVWALEHARTAVHYIETEGRAHALVMGDHEVQVAREIAARFPAVEELPPLRILPKPPFGREDATRLAHRHGWQYHGTTPAAGEQPFEKVWLAGATTVHWIEDPVLELDYFAVRGAHAVADRLRAELDTYERDDLQRLMQSDHPLAALAHVAATAPPEFDLEIFEWFETALEDADPALRTWAAMLTGYPGWPEFRAPLEVLRTDDDDEVRAVAERMLDQLRWV